MYSRRRIARSGIGGDGLVKVIDVTVCVINVTQTSGSRHVFVRNSAVGEYEHVYLIS